MACGVCVLEHEWVSKAMMTYEARRAKVAVVAEIHRQGEEEGA